MMEYDPYRDLANDVLADSFVVRQQEDIPSTERFEVRYDRDLVDKMFNNTAVRSTANVSADTSLWQNMNRPLYDLWWNIFGYGQNGDETNDWYTWDHTADSSTYNDGLTKEEYVARISTGWSFMEDGRMGEVFVTRQGAEAVQQTAQSVYDALQEYGISVLSVAADFVSEWGMAYGKTLLKKSTVSSASQNGNYSNLFSGKSL